MDTILIALLAAGGVYIFVSIAWFILMVIANWRIFTKAGRPGWLSIIPIVSGHVSYGIAWRSVFYWISLVVSAGASYCYDQWTAQGGMVYGVIATVAVLISFVLAILYAHKLARAFGKGVGFTLGLLLLPPVFTLILAFGSAQYERTDR